MKHVRYMENNYQYHIFSPYRVCPLGAHVDHQHGMVSGFAIDKGVDLWFNIREDSHIYLTSNSFPGDVHIDLAKRTEIREMQWGDYVRGVKYAMKKRFELHYGIEGILHGSLPVGGLSSSAAVLVAYVMALAKANNISLKPFDVALIASEAEREYIGLSNGILDQSCIVLGRKNQLLFLDCQDNKYKHIPFGNEKQLEHLEIAIIYSGLTRTLVNTDYNLRVYECKTAAWNMLAYQDAPLSIFEKTFLRDVPFETFQETKEKMPRRFARRAEHFYTECHRVSQGIKEWGNGDLEAFGKLIFESCESSINNYECGSKELITIYEIIKNLDGVYGGRFSGAGFKGAVIAFVDSRKKEEIEKSIRTNYLAKYPEYENAFQINWVKTEDCARFV